MTDIRTNCTGGRGPQDRDDVDRKGELVAARLRVLADYLETRPTLAAEFEYSNSYPTAYPAKENWEQILREIGAFKKHATSGYLQASVTLDADVVLEVSIAKSQTCERVQVGVKTVTKEVYPDDVQPIEVEVEEPQYEWVCSDSWLTNKETS